MNDPLNDIPGGFLQFADDGTILVANNTLREMLGIPSGSAEEDVPGRNFASLLSPAGRVLFHTHLFPVLNLRGRVDEVYLSLRSVTGEDIPVLINAARRQREDGVSINECIIILMRQRSRFEDETLRARKAAEEAVREKEVALTALALANAELEAQQEQLLEMNDHFRRRAEQEALLNRIGQTLRVRTEPGKLLETVVTDLGEAMGADRCYFAEYELVTDWARVSVEWRRPELPSLRGTYRISAFSLDIVAAYGPEGLLVFNDVHLRDAGEEAAAFPAQPQVLEALTELGIRSGISVALFEEGKLIASLNVVMAQIPRVWTQEEIDFVQEVAALTWSAANEARLRQREQRIAEHLQAALQPEVPKIIPTLRVDAYYRSALNESSVGGDFFDVFPLENGCYSLVVADLSGKGLQAASQVATVRYMLRSQLYRADMSLAQAITSLNAMLKKHQLLTGFATLFVGSYDPNRRTLVYVNAGQEPGLVRHDGSPVQFEELPSTGTVLGGFAEVAFEERTVRLAPGDTLALFTDGLTEAGPGRKYLLGISGITDIFCEATDTPAEGPREIITRIMRRVEAAATPVGMRDDICLLVACVA